MVPSNLTALCTKIQAGNQVDELRRYSAESQDFPEYISVHLDRGPKSVARQSVDILGQLDFSVFTLSVVLIEFSKSSRVDRCTLEREKPCAV